MEPLSLRQRPLSLGRPGPGGRGVPVVPVVPVKTMFLVPLSLEVTVNSLQSREASAVKQAA